MQPEQPRYSIDYLNQIAPEERRSFGGDKMFFGVIGGGLIVALFFGIFLLTHASGPSQTAKLQALAAQLQTLQQISSDADKNISSNQLQSTNANLTIQLTNTNQAIAEPLKNNGIDTTNLPKKVVAAQADTTLVNKLTDAKLNAVFDRVYSTNMSYELKTVLLNMDEIKKATKSKSLLGFINSTETNIQPIQKQLQQFADDSE